MKYIFKFAIILCLFSSFVFGAVNINTASKEELMSLPGIGEVNAKAIIEYRQEHEFNNIDEIKNVKGIANKKFEAIKDDIAITGETKVKAKGKKDIE